MTTKKTRRENLILIIILVISALLRTYHLGHSIGIHPDERHMIMVAEKISLADMNPHSFAYGSFVYYLLWACSRPLGFFSTFYLGYDGLFWVGRVICVIFGLTGIWLTARMTKSLFSDSTTALFAAALIGFNPFHLQLSRFYTVDVILTTLCTAALLSMLRIVQKSSADRQASWIRYFTCGILIGLAVASKITALFLLAPLGVMWLAVQIRSRRWPGLSSFALIFLVLLTVAVTFIAVEPYALLDFNSFLKDSNEQTTLVRGLWRAPYTIQFAHTLPYLYHLKQFFFTMGWPVAITVFCGFLFAVTRVCRKPRAEELIALAYLVPAFILIAGFQVKFPRYLLPLYPVLFAYAANFLSMLIRFRAKYTNDFILPDSHAVDSSFGVKT